VSLRRPLATALLLGATACSSAPGVHHIPLPGRPSAVAVDAGIVWVADDGAHVVRAIDESSGKPVGRPIEVSRNPIAIAASRDAVWVAHADGSVVHIDAHTREASEPIRVGGSLTGIALSGRYVWIADHLTSSVVQLDGRRRRIVRVYRIRQGAVRVAVGEGLWVTNNESTVSRIDPHAGKIEKPIEIGVGPIGLEFDGRHVWVANSDDGTVSRIDARSGRVTKTVRVGRGPIGVAVLKGVWVVNQDDRTLGRVGGDEVIDLRFAPRGVASGARSIWVVGTNPSELIRIDPGQRRPVV
jgi:YVTN family beta-propeller protein